MAASRDVSRIGVIGLGTMGQNLALNIADKGFNVSVWNRSPNKIDHTLQRAQEEKVNGKVTGEYDLADFVASIKRPRAVIILVTAGDAVDQTIAHVSPFLERGDVLIDGGNEWYKNTERRAKPLAEKGIHYMGMGVSGGEDGARHGPALMPGGPREGYAIIEPIVTKIAAQVDDGPCVTYIGEGGAGNYVKMIHNGIEYGDMQLIAETYDLLKNLGHLTNDELRKTFASWNTTELESFLIEITAIIFNKKAEDGKTYIVDEILDHTGAKGTGKMTVQEAAELCVPAPTITAALDARYLTALIDERHHASSILMGPQHAPAVDKARLIESCRRALYAAKICSYAQGMNLIKQAATINKWHLDLGEIARIWKGGCIIRAKFLNRIKTAYTRKQDLSSLLIDPEFAAELNDRHMQLREVVQLGVQSGLSLPSFSASLAYYDSYRRARLPANLTQAQRDFFGAHTYKKLDGSGPYHTEWSKL